MTRGRRIAALLALVLLAGSLASACGGLAAGTSTPTTSPPLDPNAPRAPEFTLKDLSGETVNLRDYRGQVVLINFWATWCPSCQEEVPELQAFHEEYKDRGVVILAVDWQEGKATVEEFAREYGMTFPILLDSDGRVAAQYGVYGVPDTLFLDRDLRVQDRVLGPLTREIIVQRVSRLL